MANSQHPSRRQGVKLPVAKKKYKKNRTILKKKSKNRFLNYLIFNIAKLGRSQKIIFTNKIILEAKVNKYFIVII